MCMLFKSVTSTKEGERGEGRESPRDALPEWNNVEEASHHRTSLSWVN